ncbi:MAG: acyl-CoA thioesterase [Chloroflexi bacterium]|nr:acyl-CoA thioesterase [Chloroflexota bacterium]MCI0647266.1 acyl-CoA thioesterase [Chloroflexota bacterium]
MTRLKPLSIELTLTVKTYDVDFAGIVSNIVYIRWLEDLRLQILAEYLPLAGLIAAGVGPVLTRTEIEYRRPLRLGDEAVGRMWVSKLGRLRWEVTAEIVMGEEVAAAAVQTGIFVTLATLRPAPVPAAMREKWESGR